MPVQSPQGGFNVGRDVVLDIIDASGNPKRFPIRTGFASKQETSNVKIKGADGVVRFAELPDGWSGSLDFERANSALDDYFAAVEDGYYNGQNLQLVTITETIREVSGALSQYRYVGVALKYDDAGAKTGDATIKQKVSWMASQRKKVS